MRLESVLINELQLGDTLSRAIELNRRSDFGLLLAMLSNDARDMAQFTLRKHQDMAERLQQEFELPQAQALVADLSADTYIEDNSEKFLAEGARSFQLHQALRPEALVIRGGRPSDLTEALDNTDLHTRLRVDNADPQLPPPLPLADILTMQRNFSRKITHLHEAQLGESHQAGI